MSTLVENIKRRQSGNRKEIIVKTKRRPRKRNNRKKENAGLKMSGRTVVVENKAQIDSLRKVSRGTKKNRNARTAQSGGAAMVHADTMDWVASALQPFWACGENRLPGNPFESSLAPTFNFWTQQMVTATPVENKTTGTWDVVAIFSPSDKGQFRAAATLALGKVATYTELDDPNEAFMLANIESMSVVAQGVRVENLSAVMAQQGYSVITDCFASDFVGAGAQTFQTFNSKTQKFTHSEADPGSMLQYVWLGNFGNDADPTFATRPRDDYAFCPPGKYCSVEAVNGIYWAQFAPASGGGAPPMTIEFQIVTCYNSRPLTNIPILPLRTQFADATMAKVTLIQELERVPKYDVSRVALRDDGVLTAVVQDLKNIYAGAKSVYNIGKTVAGWVSSAFSFFSSEEKIRRILGQLDDDTYFALCKLCHDSPDLQKAKEVNQLMVSGQEMDQFKLSKQYLMLKAAFDSESKSRSVSPSPSLCFVRR